MNKKVLQENLQASLNYLQKAIPSRPSLPILSSVLISVDENSCTMSATDLYFGVRTTLPAEISQIGTIAVPGKELKEVVQSLPPGEISLAYTEGQLEISSKQATSKLQCQVGDEFPQFPVVEGKEYELPTHVIELISETVLKSVSSDQTRPILTGVLFSYSKQGLRAVGTDGFRLSIVDFPELTQEEAVQFVVPGKVIEEVKKIAIQQSLNSIKFAVSEKIKQIFFSFEGVEIFARLIDGEFPPYQKIVPESFEATIELSAQELQDQVKRAVVFARESSNIIQLDYTSDSSLVVKASSPAIGVFEGDIEGVSINGEHGIIAFNAKYILDYLQSIEDETVKIEISGSLKPALFSSVSRPNYRHIIMPFRVNN